MGFSSAFQRNAFQNNAFQTGTEITDTRILQLPINGVLADQQNYKIGDSVIEYHHPNIRTKTKVSHGGGGRLGAEAPSFTVTTTGKGYD